MPNSSHHRTPFAKTGIVLALTMTIGACANPDPNTARPIAADAPYALLSPLEPLLASAADEKVAETDYTDLETRARWLTQRANRLRQGASAAQ